MKSGWTTKKLGEVCEIFRGGSPRPIKSFITNEPNGINWIKIGDTDLGGKYISSCAEKIKPSGVQYSRYVERGDFLISNSMSFGRPYILKINGCIHDGWLVIKKYEGTFDQDFLFYLLQSPSVQFQFNDLARGSTVRNLNRELVARVKVHYPETVAEQKRIVAKIDAAFEKIDRLKANAEKNLANAKELFQSALDEAMRPKKGWVEKRLGEVANIRVGPFGSSLHKADYVDNGVPLVNPCHMKDSKIADRISTQVSHDKAESLKEYRLKAGDIVFARRGEIGRLAFVSEKEDGYLCGTGSLFARFRERYDIQFLYFFFSSKSFVERLEQLSTGTTMKSINSSALESMSFSVPLMNDQQRLAKELDSLSQKTKALQQNYARQVADCAEMRQAILREAFEGRL